MITRKEYIDAHTLIEDYKKQLSLFDVISSVRLNNGATIEIKEIEGKFLLFHDGEEIRELRRPQTGWETLKEAEEFASHLGW